MGRRLRYVIKDIIKDFVKKVIKKYNMIFYFIFCFITILTVYSNLTKIEITLIIILFSLCLVGFSKLLKELNKQENFIPRLNKRFTHKNEFGNIYVSEHELREAILYLSELEDYIHGN